MVAEKQMFRRLAWLPLALGFVGACGTDAVGVRDCRDIEYARCDAAGVCGLVDDVDACHRFARDNCLHGTATGDDPSKLDVQDCVDVIHKAQTCAEDDSKSTTRDCKIELTEGSTSRPICDFVIEPERSVACAFLLEKPLEADEPQGTDGTKDAGADGG